MELICENLSFSYPHGTSQIIKNITLQVKSGEPVWIRGNSGAGKSTFLKLLSGLLAPQSGSIKFENTNFSSLSPEQKSEFRRNNIGYVHQENHLIEHWTVAQNLDLVSESAADRETVLKALNFSLAKMNDLVSEISGGEKQRISLARLMLQKPHYVFVDEPTSHLDDINFEAVVQLLNKNFKDKVLVYVSHDKRFEAFNFKQILFSELNR